MLLSTLIASGAHAAGLTVVSLNAAKETDAAKILRELNANPAVRDADVLLFQEVAQAPDQRQCAAEFLAAALDRHIVYSPAATGVTDQGLAILSRYPLRDKTVRALPAYDLVVRSRSRIALSVTVDAPSGPVRITNAHLDTRINAGDRVRQLAAVLEENGFRGPRIVGGDFNTNDFYWLGRVMPLPFPGVQPARVRSFMERHGFTTLNGTHNTHDLFQRLDWVFASGIRPRETAVYPMQFSDHHAVWVRLG